MTSSTSLIISGSSAEVGSSKSITLGSMASARAIATRCCWPPESWAGYLSAWSAMPTRSSSSMAALSAAALLHASRTLIGPSVTFSQDGLVREQVERLEDHADVGAQPGQRLALRGQRLAVEGDRAGVDRLQPVDRPAQRRLARPGRADDHDDLAAVDRQVDVLQDVQLAEVLVDLRRARRAASPAAVWARGGDLTADRRSRSDMSTGRPTVGCATVPATGTCWSSGLA